MEAVIKRITSEEKKIARESIPGFRGVTKKLRSVRSKGIKLKVQETGEVLTIPKKVFTLLEAILSNMSEGKSISIIPSDTEISTQQAAEMLNVSRPHLVKLLEAGKIPFKKTGSHRRILLEDLIAYDKEQQKSREKQLQFLADQAQKLKLGYE